MEWVRSFWLPRQGSDFAREVDFVFMGIFWLSVVLFIAWALVGRDAHVAPTAQVAAQPQATIPQPGANNVRTRKGPINN